ncbi:MAG: helix-turn-helix domain-containing protein [Thermodesulfovibrionales bacterium]
MKVSKRLYTLEEAGVYLGRSEWTVGDMIRKGILPYIPDRDRKFIDLNDLDKWIRENKKRETLKTKIFCDNFSS